MLLDLFDNFLKKHQSFHLKRFKLMMFLYKFVILMVLITLKINAKEVIISQYRKKSSKVLNVESPNQELPQTILTDWSENIKKDTSKKKPIYFLDVHKTKVKLWANMIDFSTTNEGTFTLLPPYTSRPCWWCRNTFKTSPIGCPLKYHSGNLNSLIKERIKKSNMSDVSKFFETEGIFCSTPCIKKYIKLMIMLNPSKYKDCLSLLTLLQLMLFGKIEFIPDAPDWREHTDYGGQLNSEEFRSSFGKLDYRETVNTSRPYMHPVGRYTVETKL